MWGEADSRKRGGLVRWNEWGAVKKNAKSSTLAECKIWEVGFEENVVRSVEGVAGDFENKTEHLCPAVCTTIWIQHTLSHALFCYVTLNLFKVWGDFFIPAKSTFSKHDWKELLSKYFFTFWLCDLMSVLSTSPLLNLIPGSNGGYSYPEV